jgi:hypothetical protein
MHQLLVKRSAALGALLAWLSIEAHATVLSDFTSGSEDWSVVTFGDLRLDDYTTATFSPVFVSSGGNPGGHISIFDPDGSVFTFSAPTKFLGDQTGATQLSYDLSQSVGSTNYQTTDVLILGNGIRLLWKSSPDIVPTTGWTSISVPFTPSINWRVGTTTGALATVTDFQTVLSNVSGLYIRGEYLDGVGDVGAIDNVVLTTPVPEPAPLVYLTLGLTALVLRRRFCAKGE